MKYVTKIIATILGLCFAHLAFSSVTYTYTGNPFGYNGSSSAKKITGSFTVDSAIAANTTYNFTTNGLLTNFSFTDGGKVTINLSNLITSTETFIVTTNASGIAAWYIDLFGTTYQNEELTTCSLNFAGCGPLLDATNVSYPWYYDAYTYSNNNAYGGNGTQGSWTGSVSVPEPGTLVILSLGLAGLAFPWRKKS